MAHFPRTLRRAPGETAAEGSGGLAAGEPVRDGRSLTRTAGDGPRTRRLAPAAARAAGDGDGAGGAGAD